MAALPPAGSSFFSNLSWSSLAAVPVAIATYVASAAMSVFSRKEAAPAAPPARHDRFFVVVGGRDDDVKDHFAAFAEDASVMAYLHEAGCGINGVAKKMVQLADRTNVSVSRIFLLDVDRCKSDRQQLFINGERVVWPEPDYDSDLMHRGVIQKLHGLLRGDAGKLLNITDAASQNTTIDLRDRIGAAYAERFGLERGFSPKFEPRLFTVSTWIQIDELGEQVVCRLEGRIERIEKPAASMDEDAVVRVLDPPVGFQFEGIYNPSTNEVRYRERFII